MGPLTGFRIVEIGSIGPGPMCAMLLSDMGADVLRIDRADSVGGQPGPVPPRYMMLHRGRHSVALDLKNPEAVEAVLRMVDQADALVEGYRPGVAERLGIGPEPCLARNPKLVYGRMTGWGQDGPWAPYAGHDINYIALTGALDCIGTKETPVPPLNLVGDFGGGALYLALGVVSAMLEASKSGKGQVVDAAMIDGAASLMGMMYGMRAAGYWHDERMSNRVDGGCHHYGVYEASDGGHICVGSNEPKFYERLIRVLGLEGGDLPAQADRESWPMMREKFEAIFKTKTRDEWTAILEPADLCYAPVLSMEEAPMHPHNVARGTFVEHNGYVQPAPAPRFSRTPGAIQGPPPEPGEHTEAGLADWGFSADEIAALRANGAAA